MPGRTRPPSRWTSNRDQRRGDALGHRSLRLLVLVLEALQDMARPADVLRSLRHALAPGESVMVADEKVADRFHAPGDRARTVDGRLEYRPLPSGGVVRFAIGRDRTVIRSETVCELASAAGVCGWRRTCRRAAGERRLLPHLSTESRVSLPASARGSTERCRGRRDPHGFRHTFSRQHRTASWGANEEHLTLGL